MNTIQRLIYIKKTSERMRLTGKPKREICDNCGNRRLTIVRVFFAGDPMATSWEENEDWCADCLEKALEKLEVK